MSPPRVIGLRPLPIAVALALGIASASVLAPLGGPAWPRWSLAVGLALLARRHQALWLAAVVAAGAARGTPSPAPLPPGVTADDRTVDAIRGVIRGPVIRTAHGSGAALDTGGGELWLWADAPLVPGERVAVRGLVRPPRGPRGPAMPDRRGRGARHELTADELVRLGDAASLRDRAWRWADATQARWAGQLEAAGGDPIARAALRGIVTGDRSGVPPALDERWRATGIYHVLSVSGLHLAVLAGLLFAVLRRAVAASPWGGCLRPARLAAPPALALAIAYTLVTGAQLATVRALLVVALVLLAAMLDRPVRLVDALGAAALVILAWRPHDLYDPSFQLSFTAALTLALRPASEQRGVRGWLARGLATSTWVAITTAPLTGYHFHQVAVGGLVGNLVLTPPLELCALPLGLAGIALGGLGTTLAQLAIWIVSVVDGVAGLLAHVMPVGRVAVASATVMAVLTALSLALATRTRRGRLDALGWGALCLGWALARTPPPAGALRITFLDVGQGDAALLELPDGAVWLVDAGGHASAPELAAAATPGATITRVLAAYGHGRVDLVMISHPHPDHYLGLAGLGVPVSELWTAADLDPRPGPAPARAPARLPSLRTLLDVLAARGTTLTHPPLGLARRRAGVELVVWAPRYQPADGAPPVAAADPVRGVNDNSLVVEVRYRGRSVLFGGDLEQEGEDVLVEAGLPRVDVVKVPHHGSPTSSSAAFVAATRPTLAVISCARGNSFGFPSVEVLARWRDAGAAIARTDLDGAVTVIIDAAGRLEVDRFVRAGR